MVLAQILSSSGSDCWGALAQVLRGSASGVELCCPGCGVVVARLLSNSGSGGKRFWLEHWAEWFIITYLIIKTLKQRIKLGRILEPKVRGWRDNCPWNRSTVREDENRIPSCVYLKLELCFDAAGSMWRTINRHTPCSSKYGRASRLQSLIRPWPADFYIALCHSLTPTPFTYTPQTQ